MNYRIAATYSKIAATHYKIVATLNKTSAILYKSITIHYKIVAIQYKIASTLYNTLAVKKNCSLLVQIVAWFAAVGTSLSHSWLGSESKDTVTMFNLHFCLIFRCSLRAI